jgi:serine/threonine protein kinase
MIGSIISHYDMIEQICSWSIGVIYKAEDTKLKRMGTLKFLLPELTSDVNAREHSIRETQAPLISEHNNISNIHQTNETGNGRLFIAMACYEGHTLNQQLAAGPLLIDQFMFLIR